MTWRYMLILASLPAIFLWIGIRLMPESSRWYVANMRIPEAIGSLKRVRDEEKDGSIADEVDEMLEVQRKEANQEKWSLSQIWGTKWTRHLLVIGIILGPMAETNLRRTLVMSQGDYSVFLTRPVCATFLAIAVMTLFLPIVGPKVWAWWKKRSGGPVLAEAEGKE